MASIESDDNANDHERHAMHLSEDNQGNNLQLPENDSDKDTHKSIQKTWILTRGRRY